MSKHPLESSRQIVKRYVIEGQLVLRTPAHLGNGDTDAVTDMPLLVDEATGRALLPGTSLCGALRNYLRERLLGYGKAHLEADEKGPAVRRLMRVSERLFGGEKADQQGEQSCLIVEEALGGAPRIELRDGVRIDPETRTARMERRGGRLRGFKFDMELLEAGTQFGLHLELLVPADDDEGSEDDLKQALALVLDGLARGEIGLGMRKRRGFGRCEVLEWTVTSYDLRQAEGLLAWLAEGQEGWTPAAERLTGPSIAELLGVQVQGAPDKRRAFRLTAQFQLDGSVLIRSGFGQQDRGPDTIHLHARQASTSDRQPVLSGTSLAGVLRGRAMRIARTLAGDRILPNGERQVKPQARALLNDMFGPDEIGGDGELARASRLVVDETAIRHGHELVQNRIRIDRFTGGAYESALFSEQPVFGLDQTRVTLAVVLREPREAEIGLLLLLLKDLWTGDLPLGGESSVGRGRLQGLDATLTLNGEGWTLRQAARDQPLVIEGDRQRLEGFVTDLKKELTP